MRAYLHDGQEPHALHPKAGYIGARPNYSILTDFSCNAPPVHTYGVNYGRGAALPSGSAAPPTTDSFAGVPMMPALCQVQKSPDTFFDAESGCRCALGRAPWLTQLAQLRFRLLKPVGHTHFAVHRYRMAEVLLGLLAIAPAAVKFAEAEVAVSYLRTHAAGLS